MVGASFVSTCGARGVALHFPQGQEPLAVEDGGIGGGVEQPLPPLSQVQAACF